MFQLLAEIAIGAVSKVSGTLNPLSNCLEIKWHYHNTVQITRVDAETNKKGSVYFFLVVAGKTQLVTILYL